MPPSPTSPAGQRVMEHLADGEWHMLEDVIADAATAVPPGQAWRTAEAQRRQKQTARGSEPTSRTSTDQDAIAAGARRIAGDAIRGLIRRGKVERHGVLVRLR